MPYGRGRTPLALRLNSFAQRAACFTPPAGSWWACGIDRSCMPYGRGAHAVGGAV